MNSLIFAWSNLIFSRKTLLPLWKSFRAVISVVLLTVLMASCAQFHPFSQWAQVDLDMQVTAAESPGVYAVVGSANLPDQTQITVLAVRYLHPVAPTVSLNTNPTYSILDYQSTQIMQKRWQVNLNLWKVARNGQFQESWQAEQQQLSLSLESDADVIFLATLAPVEQLPQLEQQLATRQIRLARGVVRSALDGQRYAQVNRLVSVALPTDKTNPPLLRPEDLNGGWGDRYLIPQEVPNPVKLEQPNHRRTNAAPALEEFMR
jgi:hypothetical protein